MTDENEREIARYLNAKRFLNDLKRHSAGLTKDEFCRLKARALRGDMDGAEAELEMIIRPDDILRGVLRGGLRKEGP